ncbi:MAG TPA: DUF4383 domain-containing protein [Gemmatimonadaceae bacterium]
MTSTVQRVAFVLGWILIALGIVGFLTAPAATTTDSAHAARLFGLFPVNIAHNVLHLTWGVWGIAASQYHASSREFARISGVVYLVLAALGLVWTSFAGLFPIGSNDIWLDALIGIVLAWAGFTDHARAVV